MSDNPIADAGLKLYPMAEVQDLRDRIILMNGMIVDAAEVLTKGNASMKKARIEIEQLREALSNCRKLNSILHREVELQK